MSIYIIFFRNFFCNKTDSLIILSNSRATAILMYVIYVTIKLHLLCNIFLRNCDNNAFLSDLQNEKLSGAYSEVVTQACTYAKYIKYIKFRARFYMYMQLHMYKTRLFNVIAQSLYLRRYLEFFRRICNI